MIMGRQHAAADTADAAKDVRVTPAPWPTASVMRVI
jgi:hypothetical protein